MFKKNKLYISGPLNAVRIEGIINGTKKILYLFMDYHLPANKQTECQDIRAIEFKDYLVKNFDNSTEKIDFFLEIYPSAILRKISNLKLKYIWGIQKLFKKSFNYDSKKNLVYKSIKFSNVRLHYIDIREYLFYDIFKIFKDTNRQIIYFICNITINTNGLDNLKNKILIISDAVKFMYELIYKDLKVTEGKVYSTISNIGEFSKYTKVDIKKKIEYLLNKIKTKYKNKKVQNILTYFINKKLHIHFKKYFKELKLLLIYFKKTKEKFSFESTLLHIDENNKPSYGLSSKEILDILINIYTINRKLYKNFAKICLLLVDIYFIRRFMDKNYISNGVVYTGILHSCIYLYILIKYFNFKITHSSYLKYSHEKMEKIIKNSDNINNILHMIYPPKLYQCSDLTTFPQNFS